MNARRLRILKNNKRLLESRLQRWAPVYHDGLKLELEAIDKEIKELERGK